MVNGKGQQAVFKKCFEINPITEVFNSQFECCDVTSRLVAPRLVIPSNLPFLDLLMQPASYQMNKLSPGFIHQKCTGKIRSCRY